MLQITDAVIRSLTPLLVVLIAVIAALIRHWRRQRRQDKAFHAYWDLRDEIRDYFDKDLLMEDEWRRMLPYCRKVDREYALTHPDKNFIPLEGVVLDILGSGDNAMETGSPALV